MSGEILKGLLRNAVLSISVERFIMRVKNDEELRVAAVRVLDAVVDHLDELKKSLPPGVDAQVVEMIASRAHLLLGLWMRR